MPIQLQIQGHVGTHQERRMWARRVLEHFAPRLPDLRLLIFLDDMDAPTLKAGIETRGLFHPIDKHYFRLIPWPVCVAESIRTINPNALEATYHHDAIVYLHDTTCQDESSLTMTLAHELQHYIQYGCSRDVWLWNSLITNLGQMLVALGFGWHDIPIEREARIVAKRASQDILGPEKTEKYIAARQERSVTDGDAADWMFIRELDSTQPYDCALETRRLYRERLAGIRAELEETLNRAKILPDFRGLDLDQMMGPPPFAFARSTL